MTGPASPSTPPAPPESPPTADGGTPAQPAPLLDRDQLAGAAARAGIGYAAAVAGGVAATIVGAVTSWGASDQGEGLGAGAEVAAPFVLAAAGLFGPLEVSGGDGSGGGGATVAVFPLAITLLVAAAVWGWSVWRPVRAGSPREAWVASAVTGGVLGLGAAILAAVFHVSAGDESGIASVHANPLLTFLGGVVVGTLASAAGSATRRAVGRLHLDTRSLGVPLHSGLRRAATAAVLGYGAAGVLVTLGTLVWLASSQGLGVAVLVCSLLGVNVAALGLGLGGFGGIEVSGSMFGSSSSQTLSVLGDGSPGALWLLVVAALLGTAASATLLARHVTPGRWRDAWATPTVLAVLALGTTLVAGGRATVHVDSLVSVTGSGHAILAPWAFLVAAVWGGLVEVLARTFVPALAPVWSTGSPAPAAPGGPTPSSGPGVTEAPAPLRSPVSRRAAVITLGSVGALVLVVGGAVVARNAVNDAAHGPEQAALAYVEALGHGRPSQAFAVADPDLATARRALLTDAVYGKVTDRPSAIHVRHVDVDGDSAAVTVRFDVGGTKTTQTFSLHKDGHEDLVFDHWVLDAPDVPTVTLDLGDVVATSTSVDSDDTSPVTVVVNGKTTTVDPQDPRLSLLPGRWTVTLPDAGPYLAASTVTYLVTGDDARDELSGTDDDGTLAYTFTDAALREAEKQENARLDTCFASTEAEPAGCPNDAFVWDDDAQDGRWRVAVRPTVTASPSAWNPGQIAVESSGGEATYAYTLPRSEEHYRTKTEHKTWKASSLDDTTDYQVVDGKVVQVDED